MLTPILESSRAISEWIHGMDFGVLLARFSTCKLGVKGMHPWTSPKRRKIKDALLVLFVCPQTLNSASAVQRRKIAQARTHTNTRM